MSSIYPKSITESVSKLCDELERHYPEILKKKYDNNILNPINNTGTIIKKQMEMGLYLELVKAGLGDQLHEEFLKQN